MQGGGRGDGREDNGWVASAQAQVNRRLGRSVTRLAPQLVPTPPSNAQGRCSPAWLVRDVAVSRQWV